MSTVSFTFRLDAEDKKKIEDLAKKEDRSAAYIVNQAVSEYLSKHAKDTEKE